MSIFRKQKKSIPRVVLGWTFQILVVIMFAYVMVYFFGQARSSRSIIKRVIGLPGQTIQITEGMIYIDGKVFLEQKNYPSIINPGMAADPIKLGDKEYFVLGDNRNNSEDSRFADVGLVKSDMIEGKVWFILSPSEHRGFVN